MASNVADSTATRALDVVELLENVLINLDLKDRERARGVSHNWNALITTSKSFSQTRFLSPAPYLKTFQAAKSSPRTWTSVFSEDPLWLDRIHTPVQLRSKIHIMAKMRPALQTAPGIAYPYSVMSFEATITPGEFEQWVVKSGWGKAPLTQPPIKEVIVGANTYTSQNGVTIGELCRLAKRALRQELKKPPGYLTVHKRGLSAKVNIKAPGIITDHSIYVRRGPGVEYDMLDRGQIRVCY